MISPANRSDLNGSYDTTAFTDEAVRKIQNHNNASASMYVYLAYQAVHSDGGGTLDAPLSTVETYGRVKSDTYKVMSAMVTELDDGMARVLAALKAKGMLETSVIIVTADNGGPLDHSYNWPLRGGKHTYWEGGLNVEAFVWSPLLPTTVAGTEWSGIAHTSDWQATIVEGIFGFPPADPSDSGDQGVGGHVGGGAGGGNNLWPALLSGGASPRTQVIHQVQNRFWNVSAGKEDPDNACKRDCGAAIRTGDLKLVLGYPGDERRVPVAPLAPVGTTVKFGASGGYVTHSDHASASGQKPPKGNRSLCVPHCLFNLTADPTESHDLSGDAAFAPHVAAMTKAIFDAGSEAPEPSLAVPKSQVRVC